MTFNKLPKTQVEINGIEAIERNPEI